MDAILSWLLEGQILLQIYRCSLIPMTQEGYCRSSKNLAHRYYLVPPGLRFNNEAPKQKLF
jgi:hypothetical protein